jgi:hypothetical protein
VVYGAGHPIPVISQPLPYDSKIFRRAGPDGREISADLKEAEEEVEAMVNAATLPLGILEYELRSKWIRTKQQLMAAIQEKVLQPLHQLAAELPDGEDIVRRAREAVPPPRLSLPTAPQGLASPTKPRRGRLAPIEVASRTPERSPPSRAGEPGASTAPQQRGRHRQLAPVLEGASDPLGRLREAAALSEESDREEQLRLQVLRSMRGLQGAGEQAQQPGGRRRTLPPVQVTAVAAVGGGAPKNWRR